MKALLSYLLFSTILFSVPSIAWSVDSNDSANTVNAETEHNDWLKQRFSEQHQKLIPVVAVADMFLTCNQVRQVDKADYQLDFLVNNMDKTLLAEKLANCLGEDSMQSDSALNFGLLGCFQSQLAHLEEGDREQKMQLVKQAISSLSHAERQKSFTQCVTNQSIQYLK